MVPHNNTYFYGRTSTELISSYRRISTKGGWTHTERKKQCTYGLSDWFKVDQNELKARQSGKKTGIPWPFRVKISYDVSLANSWASGVCFVLVFRV